MGGGWYGITVLCISIVGAIWASVYLVDYWRLSRHNRRSEYWWMLMALPASMAALFIYVTFARLFGDTLLRRVIGVVFWSGMMIMIPWLHRLMRKSMEAGKKRSSSTPPSQKEEMTK